MMSRKKKNKLPPFVALTWALLNSLAYKELRPSAAKMLPYFLGKVKLPQHDPGHLRTTFSFSFREATNLGFAKKTFYEVIKVLMRNGFIDPVKKGGLRSSGQTPSVFRLSDRWLEYGKPNFEKLKWECFGMQQFSYQVQKGKRIGAKNEPIRSEATGPRSEK
jgi:hypothetical protein